LKVLLSGGGTAGHIYPALTVAARFAAEHDDILFVGTPDGLEARLVPEAGIEFVGLKAAGYDRARPSTLVTSSAVIAASTFRALRLLRTVRPDVVVGFGGYVSIPVGFAARLTRTPLVLHEQNSVPGMANTTLSRWAEAVGVTYPESAERLAHPARAEVTGNPVRPAVLASTRTDGRLRFGLPADATVLLVFGGSRGARHLNTAVVALSRRLLAIPGLHVVHVAGRAEYGAVAAALEAAGGDGAGRWHVLDYVDDMGLALAAADLVVARAGATSIAEITALGLPAVLVPYPYATDDHQTKNARACVDSGAAVLIADAELDEERFGDELAALLGDPGRRATMAAASRALGRPDAAERVVSLARSSARRSAHTD
jgi:UDP-N-acetylglucosamine--N-acetylmuramyl-(pentapeptide) pyrophosphoryl-undecaprenol N-acetylglucosamine transferase